MRKLTLKLIGAAAAAVLAAPALAAPAPPALAPNPPMADGDMGCFIALGVIAIDAEKAAKSEKLAQKDRDLMAGLAVSMRSDARWYFGRISMLPPEKRTREVFSTTFQRIDKTDKKQTFEDAFACSKWAKVANDAMLDSWSGK